jgi:hypothetical protein
MRIRSGIVAIALLAAAPLSAATYVWPTGACVGTLQACFDGAGAGDVIQIAANGPIATGGAFTLDKGLTIEPAPGFSPVLTGGLRFESTNQDVTVVVQDLQMEDSLDGRLNGGFELDLSVLRCGFVTDNRDGVALFWDGSGDLSFEIDDNTFEIAHSSGGNESAAIHLHDGDGSGVLQGIFQRNQIHVDGGDSLGAVVAFAPRGGLLGINNVIRNTNSAGTGIMLASSDVQTQGTIALAALGNVISGTDTSAFGQGALALHLTSGFGGLQMINNTLADNLSGVVVSGTVPDTAFEGTSSNNIVAFNTSFGFDLGVYGAHLQSGYDLVFGNAANNGYAGATNQIVLDPAFAGAGNYRLTASSPARDSGNNAVVGILTNDVEGNPRIIGSVVDRGAYEFLPSVIEVPALGTTGLVLLAISLALAGWVVRRRNAW